jgi:hypothetical protein
LLPFSRNLEELKMKKLLLATAVLAATSATQAATFDVSGTFTTNGLSTANNLQITLGGPNVLDPGASITFSGQVENDGTTITGGTITATGTQTLAPTGIPITIDMNLSGTATSSGVLFTSGTICVTAATACDSGLIDASVDNISFLDGVTWGYGSGTGLALGDGTETSDYTVAQAGTILATGGPFGGGSAGGAVLLGNAAGIYLAGDLTFTEAAVVPVPAAAWLFGSALVGLAGIGRKRNA